MNSESSHREICFDGKCPVKVTHYVGEAPGCVLQPPRQEGETPSLSDLGDANDSDSIVASCNCFTKTPDIQFHKRGCKYRLIEERNAAEAERDRLREVLEDIISARDASEMYSLATKALSAASGGEAKDQRMIYPLVCQACGALTHPAYKDTPNLTCWACDAAMSAPSAKGAKP